MKPKRCMSYHLILHILWCCYCRAQLLLLFLPMNEKKISFVKFEIRWIYTSAREERHNVKVDTWSVVTRDGDVRWEHWAEWENERSRKKMGNNNNNKKIRVIAVNEMSQFRDLWQTFYACFISRNVNKIEEVNMWSEISAPRDYKEIIFIKERRNCDEIIRRMK